MLFIIGNARQAEGQLIGGIVGTLMSNLGLEQACKTRNIPFKRAAVGDRYVMNLLEGEGWELGGESSGHIICLDKSTTGDGIIAALQVLAVMAQNGRPLAELKAGMQIFPQTMINVRTRKRLDVRDCKPIQDAVSAAESRLAENGRVLLRASGTEPVIRVMVEGRDSNLVQRLGKDLAEVVRQAAREVA
jgi:phosphoglucosamine mutase